MIKKILNCSCLPLTTLAVSVNACSSADPEKAEKPNILIILADDMGYSDVGCYGGEVETPNIDRLAQNGLRYRQFYNCARSCPTRAALLTGLYPHQAGMGWMTVADMQRPEYQGYLNDRCVTIGDVMQTSGYGTYMVGKWHVSGERQNKALIKDNWPLRRGFDRFYGIVRGASNYFNVNYVYDNEEGQSPDDGTFYFTHAISDSATAFVTRHDYRQAPLFMYVAYTAAHWPLHALQKDIDKYVERYKKGWDVLREERFARQQKMGLFGKDAVLSPRDEAVAAWDSISPEQQQEFVMRMAIYAAQIDAMDQGIGRIVQSLKDRGQLDNTLIMFLSDNGACAEFVSGGQRKAVDGKADTHESYRINWANLSSTPYREYKHFTNEGGIATPLIVHYPNGVSKKLNNTFVDEYGHLIDLMATCADAGKAVYPATYRGREITPMQGVSLIPNFSGNRTNRGATYWEHEANIAMRDGKWKIVAKTPERTSFDNASIKLYDMEADPTEMHDLSQTHPDRVKQMFEAWDKWAKSIGAYPLDSRTHGDRTREYKRVINGEFNDNFADWQLVCGQDAQVNFTIDTVNVISGKKTAKIEVVQKGKKPASAQMKWTMNLRRGEKPNIGFQAKADRKTNLILRMEKVNKPEQKALNETIALTPETKNAEFKNIRIEEDGNYQLVFYVGNMEGTCWVDNIELKIEN
ncbi:MAG: arylsulfatase [Bacteroidales bacterium]|jgi:arylsulfatase|nr:arylsulfatase [Bacteroidales bacterium]